MPVPSRDPKGNRSGYTTGACAAAAAKTATRCLLGEAVLQEIETTFPNKRRKLFLVELGEPHELKIIKRQLLTVSPG